MAAPASADEPSVSKPVVSVANAAAACLADVHAFNGQLEKEGYRMGASDYGYGYPVGRIVYGDGYSAGGHADGTVAGANDVVDAPDYCNARPGYEMRILLGSVNILAQNGRQQGCEDALDTTRAIYKIYVSEMHERGLQPIYEPAWQQKEIAAARPVSGDHTSYRSDELIDIALTPAQFQQESQTVDAYWTAHVPPISVN
jgi:hypothetical protein